MEENNIDFNNPSSAHVALTDNEGNVVLNEQGEVVSSGKSLDEIRREGTYEESAVPVQTQTEEEKLAQATNEFSKLPKESQAILVIKSNLAQVMPLVEKCNKEQLKRTIFNLLEYPFNENAKNFTDTHEEELYNIGANVANAKLVLFSEQMEKEKQAKLLETNVQENKEIVNGSTDQ